MDLKEKISKFPKTPGIYFMKDKEDNIIYIGKSKKLRDRIKSYFFSSNSHSRKIKRMVSLIKDIDIIETDTELDALLLECEYIKKVKPMYNTLLKNHDSYSYIKINTNNEFPYIEVVNKIDDDSIYFGPYSKQSKLEEVRDILNRTYKLRKCKKMSKCFNYDLNKCIGPCRNIISSKDYKDIVNAVINDLSYKNNNTLDILENNMKKEILNLNFEIASNIKSDIDKLSSLFNKQEVINSSIEDKVILAWMPIDESVYKVYIIRKGILELSDIIEKNIFDNIDKENYIKENINENIKIDKVIDKCKIDFMIIIYNYIKYSKDIKSITIDYEQ